MAHKQAGGQGIIKIVSGACGDQVTSYSEILIPQKIWLRNIENSKRMAGSVRINNV